MFVQAVLIELPAFERRRADYLDEGGFARLQMVLMADPLAGDLIEGTGGLRKLRFADTGRGKGKRGGLRVIYYYWAGGPEFWLFTVYDKGEMDDLTPRQRAAFRQLAKAELRLRRDS